MKGASQIIAAVMLIVMVVGLAALIAPWLVTLTQETTNKTGSDINQKILCQNLAYDFDSDYGNDGITWNFSGIFDNVKAKVVNTGKQNIHTFSFELETNESETGLTIRHYDTNRTFQKTSSLPLKPGESAFLDVNITHNLNGTLQKVKILNGVCPNVFIVLDV